MGVKYNWGIEVYLTPTWPAPLFIPPVMVSPTRADIIRRCRVLEKPTVAYRLGLGISSHVSVPDSLEAHG